MNPENQNKQSQTSTMTEPQVITPVVPQPQPIPDVQANISPVIPSVQQPAQTIAMTPAVAQTPQVISQNVAIQQQQNVGSASLNVEALRGYEQSQIGNSTWSVMMADPQLKKQFIIGAVLIATLLLAIVGIVMTAKAYLQAASKSKKLQQDASNSIYQTFAAQNNLNILTNDDPLLKPQQLGILAQYEAMGGLQQAPAALSGLLDATKQDTPVSGTLAGGTIFTLQDHHFDIHVQGDENLIMGIDHTDGLQIGGVGIGVGTSVGLGDMQNIRSFANSYKETTIFKVTKTIKAGENSFGDADVSIIGHYNVLSLSMIMPGKILPHFILEPIKNGFSLPFIFSGHKRLELEGNINEYFYVGAPEGYEVEVLQILEPNVLAQIIDIAQDVTLEFVGDRLNIYYVQQPFTQPSTIADGVTHIYNIATRFEPWFKKEMSTFNFTPQQQPFELKIDTSFNGINASMVASHLRRTDKSYVSWSEHQQSATSFDSTN